MKLLLYAEATSVLGIERSHMHARQMTFRVSFGSHSVPISRKYCMQQEQPMLAGMFMKSLLWSQKIVGRNLARKLTSLQAEAAHRKRGQRST